MSNIDRRDFLRWTSAGVAGHALLGCGAGARNQDAPDGGAPPTGADASPDANPGGGAVDAGAGGADAGPIAPLANRTPASLLLGSRAELELELDVVWGALPPGLHGHYFMVCPIPWGDGTPVPNGDGSVFRLDFGGASPRLKTMMMKTPCYYAEKALVGSANAFANNGFARIAPGLGVRNQANTGLVPMGADRMLVTYDAGRPFELDPVSLEVATGVGYLEEWRPGLPAWINGFLGDVFPLVRATAHPCYDPHTTETFAINYGMEDLIKPFLDVLRWDGEGELERWTLVTDDGQRANIAQSGHQMQVTEKYVVVLDCAFRVEVNPLDPNAFEPQSSEATLYVVDRADLDRTASGGEVLARRFVIPREAPHFLVDYDNPEGRLVVHLIHNSAFDASEWIKPGDTMYGDSAPARRDLLGMLTGTTDLNQIGRHVIDVPGNRVLSSESTYLSDPELTWGVTLYTHQDLWSPPRHEHLWWVSSGFQNDILPRRLGEAYAGYAHRTVAMADLPFRAGKPAALFCTSVRDAAIVDAYRFPAGRAASSPQFIPPAGGLAGAAGYIVCTVVSDDTQTAGSSGDEFWIFDAADLARGPLCRLAHPDLIMPYTLHTTWLPSIASRSAGYRVDVRADHAPRVAKLDATLRRVFEDAVYPHFE